MRLISEVLWYLKSVMTYFQNPCSPGESELTHWGRRNGRHFADDIVKYIFLNENAWILIEISLKFVSKGPVNNIPALYPHYMFY